MYFCQHDGGDGTHAWASRRFVTGYALRQEGGEWVARESTAHAWVECYFPGVGWLTFDPTGGAGYTNGHEAVITTTSTSGTTGTTTSRGDTTTTSRTTGASSSAHTTTQRSTTATTAPQDTELLRVQIPPWVWYAVLPGAAVLALCLRCWGESGGSASASVRTRCVGACRSQRRRRAGINRICCGSCVSCIWSRERVKPCGSLSAG